MFKGKSDTEFAAEVLLASVERDPAAPHYLEESFERKLRTAAKRDRSRRPATPDERAPYLAAVEWEAVLDIAKLTEKQTVVLLLKMEGHTFEEIGDKFGHSKQGAQRSWNLGMRKLARALEACPLCGLASVYREDVRRRPDRIRRRR